MSVVQLFQMLLTLSTAPALPTVRAVSDSAWAVITADSAVFAFPADSVAVVHWNRHLPGQAAGSADRYWRVEWSLAQRPESQIDQIMVERRYRPGEAEKSGSMAELLAQTIGEEGSSCAKCQAPLVIVSAQPRVTHRVWNGQVTLVVTGRDLIQRYFAGRPSQVDLTWTREGGVSRRTIPVSYR
jgi:hypothetical protein